MRSRRDGAVWLRGRPVRLDAETEEVGAACGEGALAIPLLRDDAENCPQPSRRMDAPRPRLSARRRRPRFGGDDNHRTLVIQKDGSTCEISNGKMINCWR